MMCSFSQPDGPEPPQTYDGSKCHCNRCPNSEMCGPEWLTEDFVAMKGGYCINCDMFGFQGGRLSFRDCPAGEECAVCYGNGRQVKFPADGCVHWFCVGCTQTLVYWDETRYHLNPCLFGCPPCPNGCDNPTRGRQCYCVEYDCVKREWEHGEPKTPFWGNLRNMKSTEFCLWNMLEHESIETGEPPGSCVGKGECPLCKRRLSV